MTLLLDIGSVPPCCADDAFEILAKAMTEDAGGPVSHLWDPLPNRWARAHVEAATARMREILQRMLDALGRFLRGNGEELRKADVPWLRWDETQFEAVRRRLESKDPGSFTIDDWMLLVDWLIQRYLPDDVINAEADYLAVRSQLLGKIQANLERDQRVNDPFIASLTALLPTAFIAVPPRILTPLELSILAYGRAHAGENIRQVTQNARHRMATICLEHIQGGLLGQKEGTWKYAESRLFGEFAVLNRDYRRIAVTEGGEAVNQGYILARGSGQKVKRQEAYRGACPFCKSIDGKVFTIVAPDAPDKDGDTQIWVGKTNVGRSASPRRREGNALVEREPSEMWWPAAGVQHPNCRGSWVPVTTRPPEVSEDFAKWLQGRLDAAREAAPPKMGA